MSQQGADPATFFRELLGQWEQLANQMGGEAMKAPGFAQAMHGANAASLQAQGATQQFMERALAAANMPSRSDFADLSARLARVEEAVARIEAAVAPPQSPGRAKPARTRTPPRAPA